MQILAVVMLLLLCGLPIAYVLSIPCALIAMCGIKSFARLILECIIFLGGILLVAAIFKDDAAVPLLVYIILWIAVKSNGQKETTNDHIPDPTAHDDGGLF